MPAPIADALVLTLTERTSLVDWHRAGLLDRELALYRRVAGAFGRVVLVTWGDAADERLAAEVWPEISVITHRGDPASPGAAEQLGRALAGVLPARGRVIVKTNQFPGGELALTIARRLRRDGHGVGLVARGGYHWSRFEALEHGPGSDQAALAGMREGALVGGADLVVGTSRSMLDDIAWRYGIGPERTALIPNYLTEDAEPDPSVSRDSATVLFAGRLVEQKRVVRLIDAVSIMNRGRAAPARLLVVGDGPLESALRDRARACGAPVEFRSRVPHSELMGLMRRCAVYAQASAYEGHPKTVLEAMACACPVVVTRGPGLSDVVNNGRTGVVVEAEAEAIARALGALLDDRDHAASLGAEASRRVREDCSLDRVAELELEACERALANAASRAGRPAPGVRWDSALLDAPTEGAVGEWARSVRGFARRLAARDRAAFLMALDSALYDLQGESAVEACAGLHPKHRLMNYHDFFVRRTARGERVIDLGSGNGAVACSVARESGATVVGVELNPANAEAARRRAEAEGLADSVRFVEGDITRDRVPGRFDAVVLSNVLEHVPDRARLLRQWAGWYAPSRFLIRVPAFDRDWRTPWKRELGVEWRLDPTHETEYTLDSLEREATEAGLTIGERVINWGEYWVVAVPRASSEAAA